MNPLPPEFFRRQDESPDVLFYERPHRSSHLDAEASRRAQELYDRLLPAGGRVLDLMASARSHLPDKFERVHGLGLNRAELDDNPLVDEPVVHDLNEDAALPFADASFDGAVCTAAAPYMTRPAATFAEVGRSLRPGAPFVVTFSNRMYPTKAVLAWRASDDAAHVRLVESYFRVSGAFGPCDRACWTPATGDPLFAVWSRRLPLRGVHGPS